MDGCSVKDVGVMVKIATPVEQTELQILIP